MTLPTNFEPRAFASDYINAINNKDPESVFRYYAENVEITDPTTTPNQPLRGTTGVRKAVQLWANAMSENKIDIKESIVSGNKAVVLFVASGRHTGELELSPSEKVPATNKPVRLEVANFLTLDNEGKIVKDHSIFDVASLMTQLGLMPATQGTGATSERARTPGAPERAR